MGRICLTFKFVDLCHLYDKWYTQSPRISFIQQVTQPRGKNKKINHIWMFRTFIIVVVVMKLGIQNIKSLFKKLFNCLLYKCTTNIHLIYGAKGLLYVHYLFFFIYFIILEVHPLTTDFYSLLDFQQFWFKPIPFKLFID